jgi:hypothetical protein
MWKPNIESQINSQLNSTINSTLNGSMNSARQGLTGGKNFKSYFLYTLVTMLVFALVGWAATLIDITLMLRYFSVQVIFLLLGVIHAAYVNDLLPQIPKENFSKGVIFTLILTVCGILGMFLLTLWGKVGTDPRAYLTAALTFIIPFIFMESFERYFAIPDKDYKRWYYDPHATGPDFARINLQNIMVIHYVFPRRHGENLYTNFSAKAPYDMRFGDLFKIFLDDYNRDKPDQAIEIHDGQGQSYGWLFMEKRPWYRKKAYFDPDYSFRENFLSDGTKIVAKRVQEHYELPS